MDNTVRYQQANDILRAVGHDLKSPLTAVIGALEAMKTMGPRLSEQQRDIFCGLALKESYRLQHFVQNIMLLARLDSGAYEIMKTEMTLQDVLSPINAKMAAEHPHVAVRVENPDVRIKADAKWLGEALLQIMDNTGRHNPDPVELTISAGENKIMMVDDGSGIPSDIISTVFDRHVKGPATAHQDASAGVGLTIVQMILRAHGGDIRLLPGSGTQLELLLA